MNYFKRSWLSVVRRKGKSLILLIVIFILGNVIAGAFSIQQASKNVEKNIKQQLGATATIELDWAQLEAAREKDPNFNFEYNPLDLKTIEEIGQNEYVRYYDYSFTTSLATNTLKRIEMESDDSFSTINPFGTYFTMAGVQYPEVSDIVEGKLELTSGRVFTQEEIDSGKLVTIVSEEFLKANGLAVGDTITLQNQVSKFDQQNQTNTVESERDISLEIIGVFKPLVRETEKDDSNQNNGSIDQKWQVNELHNKMFIPNKVAFDEALYGVEGNMKMNPEWYSDGKTAEEYVMQSVIPTFAIKDPESLEAFREQVAHMVPEYHKLSVSSDAYDSIAGPIKSLDSMSSITLVVAIGATILILSLVIVLFLRDRKHELGIYLSLGDRRSGVLRQIVMEVAMVALVGLTLSLVTGNVIASGMSQSLMNNATPENEMNAGMGTSISIGGPQQIVNVSEADAKDAYKVELTPQYIGLFYLIGLGVTIGSTIIPIVYITRLNPKKIMM